MSQGELFGEAPDAPRFSKHASRFHLRDLGFEMVSYMNDEPAKLAGLVEARGLPGDDDLAELIRNSADYQLHEWTDRAQALADRGARGDAELADLCRNAGAILPEQLQRMTFAVLALEGTTGD